MQAVETRSCHFGHLHAKTKWRGRGPADPERQSGPENTGPYLRGLRAVVRDGLEAGVRGWVFKSDGTDDLKTAVEAVERYECTFSSRVSDLTMTGYLRRYRLGPAAAKVTKLSPREREVLQLLGEGKTSKEVAILLNVKVKTTETHRSNIMLKLNLHSIVERLLYAVRNELDTCNSRRGCASPTLGMDERTWPAGPN